MVDVSFIIVNYNTKDLLADCLESIYARTAGVSFEVVVVDNASADGSCQMVRDRFPQVVLVESKENLGFGRGNNVGVEHSSGDYLMLFNSDAVLLQDTASGLYAFMKDRPEVGIVGPAVLLRDGSVQEKTRGMLPTVWRLLNQNLLLSCLFPASKFFAGLYVERAWARESRIGWVSGVCMLIRREAYLAVEGFDPSIFMYAEDVDLCLRCSEFGWETWRVEDFAIMHFCGGSTKSEAQVLRNRVLQQRNFFRVFGRSMGSLGRLVTRIGFILGLCLRVLARALPRLAGRGRVALKADLMCLADLFRCGSCSNGANSVGSARVAVVEGGK